jgi:hypothetical protein
VITLSTGEHFVGQALACLPLSLRTKKQTG